ncbi:Hypothetical predicted protein [Pelobates cultripes]|uniref:Uncharacterized protein n=1 Tax=Pelobates cultripes TaxID=61616 RepID=A0AAD1R1S4_PELCU|nr:Hypothetical predicted protein [Pelobates cultripes]
MPSSCSPGREDRVDTPTTDWLTLLKALPTREDLTQVTSALHASIIADLQRMRTDKQGMADRMARVEADLDVLMTAQTSTTAAQKHQTVQL